MRFSRSLAVAGAGTFMLAGTPLRAQDVQLADNGPRFVSVASRSAPPVDMSGAPALQRRVTLEIDRVALDAALGAVGKQAHFRLLFSADVVPVTKPVTVHADGITVAAALTELLIGTGVDVQLAPDGKSASLVPKPGRGAGGTNRQQATGQIEGRVMDATTRAPLDQVAIRVEGSDLGATTTADGRYAIRNIQLGTYRVTGRRVGYTPLTKTITVTTNATATVDFALVAAPTRLDEMVTTAVGDQRRYEVGNVISTINADSIAPTAPITSLTDLISARAPGVTVEEASGLTGGGEAIRIRGQSSLVLQGDPIVIVDGVREDNTSGGTPLLLSGYQGAPEPSPSRLNDLDFNDVATIDVLKGPAASTEYGTDAANGVIVITTKHGTAGHPQWAASAEGGVSQIPVSFPTYYYSWGHTTDVSHTPVDCPLIPYFIVSGYGSTAGTCAVDSVTTWDPLNEGSQYSIFGTGHRQKYDLSVSGGSDAVRYFVSGALSHELGVLQLPGVFVPQAEVIGLPRSAFRPNGEDQRAIRANTAIRLGPTADLAVTGTYTSTYQTNVDATNLYRNLVLYQPLRDSVNNYGYGGFPVYSPVYRFGFQTNQQTTRIAGGVTANWRPTSWFVGHSTVGVDHGSQRNQDAILPQVGALTSFAFYGSQFGIGNATTDIYTVDLRGSATAAISRAVRAVTSIGVQLADARQQGVAAVATGVTATNFTLNGAVSPTVTQLGDRQATLGGYGEEQLGFADRLFLTAALRIDAGSGFGRAYSTAVYPKASASWLPVNAGSTTVRLRGAFGESGVQPPNGAALELYAPATVALNGGATSAVAIANVQNALLQPERSEEYEGGVDIGLWRNRVSVELTGYSKTTHNALVSTGAGWEAGGLPFEENVGEVRNIGLEGAVTATIVQGRALAWDVTFNGSLNRNKLLTLAPGILPQQSNSIAGTYRFQAGYPLYGYWAPELTYADRNHDGVLETNEVAVADTMSYMGSSLPTREASLGTRLTLWSGAVSLGALVDYRGGFRLANSLAYNNVLNAEADRASNDRTAPLWQQARDISAEVIEANGLDGYATPAGFYADATFLRVRELSLTYAVPQRVVRALRVQRLGVTAAVRNLALWTRYEGVDPEVSNAVGANGQLSPTSNRYVVNNDIRADQGAVPLLRYWVLRLNVGW